MSFKKVLFLVFLSHICQFEFVRDSPWLEVMDKILASSRHSVSWGTAQKKMKHKKPYALSLVYFALPLLCAGPQLTEHLEEDSKTLVC